jgi:single-strand DNA-binding protein
MNVNKILITGNVTADPELRYTPSGKAVLSASVANNEYYNDAQGQEQKVTTFVNLEVWGKPAENFGKLVKKGQEVLRGGQTSHGRVDRQTNQRPPYASLSPRRKLAIHPVQAPRGEHSRCSPSPTDR